MLLGQRFPARIRSLLELAVREPCGFAKGEYIGRPIQGHHPSHPGSAGALRGWSCLLHDKHLRKHCRHCSRAAEFRRCAPNPVALKDLKRVASDKSGAIGSFRRAFQWAVNQPSVISRLDTRAVERFPIPIIKMVAELKPI